jgi:hypothetical protein
MKGIVTAADSLDRPEDRYGKTKAMSSEKHLFLDMYPVEDIKPIIKTRRSEE